MAGAPGPVPPSPHEVSLLPWEKVSIAVAGADALPSTSRPSSSDAQENRSGNPTTLLIDMLNLHYLFITGALVFFFFLKDLDSSPPPIFASEWLSPLKRKEFGD